MVSQLKEAPSRSQRSRSFCTATGINDPLYKSNGGSGDETERGHFVFDQVVFCPWAGGITSDKSSTWFVSSQCQGSENIVWF